MTRPASVIPSNYLPFLNIIILKCSNWILRFSDWTYGPYLVPNKGTFALENGLNIKRTHIERTNVHTSKFVLQKQRIKKHIITHEKLNEPLFCSLRLHKQIFALLNLYISIYFKDTSSANYF